jgi:hypothetical protein
VPQPKTDRERAINELARDLPAHWDYGPVDAPIVYAALERLRTDKPRVLYVMLGEGDEWAHAGRYDLYLDATFRADRFIHRVWDTLQSLPEYAEPDDAARDDGSRAAARRRRTGTATAPRCRPPSRRGCWRSGPAFRRSACAKA